MWCGSFSTTGPTVAVLTTFHRSVSRGRHHDREEVGAGGSSTASSLSVLTGFTGDVVLWTSEPLVSARWSHPPHEEVLVVTGRSAAATTASVPPTRGVVTQ